MPPTGKSTSTDYVYVMEFEDGKISHIDQDLERLPGDEGSRLD
jgi:ketosteroid isomerase-like protein